MEYVRGMLARSKAGHDTGNIYVIIDVDDAYVYLADGSIRTLDRLKKKKKSMSRLYAGNMMSPQLTMQQLEE